MVDVGGKPVTARRAVADASVRMQPGHARRPPRRRRPEGRRVRRGAAGRHRRGQADRRPDPALPSAAARHGWRSISSRPRRHGHDPRRGARHRAHRRRDGGAHRRQRRGADPVRHGQGAPARHRHRARRAAREGGRPQRIVVEAEAVAPARPAAVHEAVVVTCSNRSAAGERDDTAGPPCRALRAAGFDVAGAVVVPMTRRPSPPPWRAGRRRASAHRHHRRHRAHPDRRHAGGHAARHRPGGAGPGRADARRRPGLHAHGLALAGVVAARRGPP